jgi:alpha-1,3-mannosyltransferase
MGKTRRGSSLRRPSLSLSTSSTTSKVVPLSSPLDLAYQFYTNLIRTAFSLANDWHYFPLLALLLLSFEALLSALIIYRVPYTEIDWRAYMQEVEGWVVRRDSPTNYITLKGSTGPLVYPAGFLYIYRLLRWIASSDENCEIVASASALDAPPEPCGGLDVKRAQWVFYCIYLVSQALVLDIYNKTRPGPPWICLLLVLSKRLHSLFLLRLFNDCIAMLFAHAAISLIIRNHYLLGTLLFSISISVKMNALLALPALGLVLLRNTGVVYTTVSLSLAIALQIFLGIPFLQTHPYEYLSKAFEFSRVFFHQWTVNWKFVPETIFISKQFAQSLLICHLGFLLLFAHFIWLQKDGGLTAVVIKIINNLFSGKEINSIITSNSTIKRRTSAYNDSTIFIVQLVWTSVFIGIVFSRTLHFQFYSWYFHSIPFLLWRSRFFSYLFVKKNSTDIKFVTQTRSKKGEKRLVDATIEEDRGSIGSIVWLMGLIDNIIRIAIFFAIEYAFNIVDQSLGPDGRPKGEPLPSSALVLQSAHGLLLLGLLFGLEPSTSYSQ